MGRLTKGPRPHAPALIVASALCTGVTAVAMAILVPAACAQVLPDGRYSVKESWQVTVNERPYKNTTLTKSGSATGTIQVVGGDFDLVNQTGVDVAINEANSIHRSFTDSTFGVYNLYDGVPVFYGAQPGGTPTQSGDIFDLPNATLFIGLSFFVVPVPLGTDLQFDYNFSQDSGYTTGVGNDGLAYDFQGTSADVNGEEFDVSSSSTLTVLQVFTATPAPSATPTPTGSACVGDCDGSGGVSVNEIIILVNIALGTADAAACPNGIPSGANVDITLIIQVVNNALNGGCS